jgi:hypothetical protein
VVGHQSVPQVPHEGNTQFVDVTESSRLAWTPEITDWQDLIDDAPPFSEDYNQWGGFAVGDFNGDDALDVLFTNKYDIPRLFLSDGPMRFREVPPEDSGLTQPSGQLSGASAIDFDGDGDLDVLLVGRVTVLLENRTGDGGPLFQKSDLIGDSRPTEIGIELTASWVDVDGDGDLDVHLTNWGWDPGAPPPLSRDRFLVQEDGEFEDRIDDLLPVEYDGAGYAGAWTDIDSDGDPDLVLVQEADPSGDGATVFLRNRRERGGGLAFEVQTVGLEVVGCSMGVGLGDYDLDGDIDVHMTDIGPTRLFEQRGGSFIDVSTAVSFGISAIENDASWSTFFEDLNNDGTLELYTAFGVLGDHAVDEPSTRVQPDRIWQRGPDGVWSDVGAEMGLTHGGSTRGAMAVDLDGDGCSDILSFHLLSGPQLLQGICPSDNTWITVSLEDRTGANINAIGALVEVSDGADQLGMREVYAGSVGVFTGGPPEVRFGLGHRETIDLRVRWPTGHRTCNQGVPTRQRLTLTLAP